MRGMVRKNNQGDEKVGSAGLFYFEGMESLETQEPYWTCIF
jgi:hypothetical protein